MFIPFGFAQATLNFTGPTRTGRAAVVLGMDTGTSADLTDLAERVANAWQSEWRPITHVAWALSSVKCEDMVTAGETIPEGATGTRTGDLASPQVSTLLSKSSNLKGRPFRGRTYWPGLLLDGDIYDDGTIREVWRGNIQEAADGFWADLTSTVSAQQVILHNAEIAPTPVASYGCQVKVATQRRRLR